LDQFPAASLTTVHSMRARFQTDRTETLAAKLPAQVKGQPVRRIAWPAI